MGYFEDITAKKKKKKSLGWKAKKALTGISVDIKYKQQQQATRKKELAAVARKAARKEEGKQVAKRAREKVKKKYQPQEFQAPQFNMFGFEPATTSKKKKKQKKEVDYYTEFFG